MTDELKESGQKSKVRKISPVGRDASAIHYVRIKMLTLETISLICIAP
jgi:hypothetical protein